jgi:hypothetical protein
MMLEYHDKCTIFREKRQCDKSIFPGVKSKEYIYLSKVNCGGHVFKEIHLLFTFYCGLHRGIDY